MRTSAGVASRVLGHGSKRFVFCLLLVLRSFDMAARAATPLLRHAIRAGSNGYATSSYPAAAAAGGSFRYEDLVLRRAAAEEEGELQPLDELKFGQSFTGHRFAVRCAGGAWQAPEIVPFGRLAIHPASPALQYGMSCFEGMKAFRSLDDGRPLLFRPELNMARFASSIERLQLPPFDPAELLECIKELIRVDETRWLPRADRKGYSLYLRPFAMGTTESLGVAPAEDAEVSAPIHPSSSLPLLPPAICHLTHRPPFLPSSLPPFQFNARVRACVRCLPSAHRST